MTDLRRAAIIAAALKVFARKGFAHARAEDVAAQARIAKGTLYLYFKSKEAIYEAALEHAMTRLRAMVAERMEAATDVRGQVHAFVSARLEFWGEQGDLYRMILTLGRERKHRRQTAALLQAGVDELCTLLQRDGVAGGQTTEALLRVGWAAMDMIRGGNERRIDGNAIVSAVDEAEFITDAVMRAVQSTTGAAPRARRVANKTSRRT